MTCWLVTCTVDHLFPPGCFSSNMKCQCSSYPYWLNGNSTISVGMWPSQSDCMAVVQWCGRSRIVTSCLFHSVKREAATRLWSRNNVTSGFPMTLEDCLMKAFDSSLFLEPLLHVDADLISVREIYLRRPSPHTTLSVSLPLTPHLFSFCPPLLPPPLGRRELSAKERWMMLFWTVTCLHGSHSIIIHK